MRIVVRARANEDLDGIYRWISAENPKAARDAIRRIRAKIGLLAETGFPEMGRPGIEPGTRELIEAPYIIVYEFIRDRDEIVILAIFHGAEDRTPDD